MLTGDEGVELNWKKPDMSVSAKSLIGYNNYGHEGQVWLTSVAFEDGVVVYLIMPVMHVVSFVEYKDYLKLIKWTNQSSKSQNVLIRRFTHECIKIELKHSHHFNMP